GSRVFAYARRSGWGDYTLTNGRGRRARVRVGVKCRNRRGERGRHGRERLVYAFWGVHPPSLEWLPPGVRRPVRGVERLPADEPGEGDDLYSQPAGAAVPSCGRPDPAERLGVAALAGPVQPAPRPPRPPGGAPAVQGVAALDPACDRGRVQHVGRDGLRTA